jgi:hypothetical protein
MFFFSQMSICTSSNLLDGKHDIVVLVMHAAKVYSLVSLKLDGRFMVRRKLLRDLAEVTFSLA